MIKTISQIMSVLIPIVWVICMTIYRKTRKLETLTSWLCVLLMFIGAMYCFSQGLDLIGVE